MVTETLAVPVTPLLLAATANGPPTLPPAVNRPLASIVPPPLTDQAKAGGGLITASERVGSRGGELLGAVRDHGGIRGRDANLRYRADHGDVDAGRHAEVADGIGGAGGKHISARAGHCSR